LGALMALFVVEELIDINPRHGLRFGNLDTVEDASTERYLIDGSLYDVSQTTGSLEVRRDGRLLMASDGPVEVRHVLFRYRRVEFEVRCKRAITLQVGNGGKMTFPPGEWKGEGLL
jgi:hypothetical protein